MTQEFKMTDKTKMFICGGVLILLVIIYQIFYGSKASILIGGIILFSIGFGWYAHLTKQLEDLLTKK